MVHSKADVLLPVFRCRLHDHVHIDLFFRQAVKNFVGNAGDICRAGQADHRHIQIPRYAADISTLHGLLPYERARFIGKAGTHLQIHPVPLCHLHRPVVQHLGAHGRQLKHLVICDLIQFPRPGYHPGVGCVYAVHIGVDDAPGRPQGRSQRHGSGVGTAPADGGDVAVFIHALEPGHHHDLVLGQLFFHPPGFHVADAGGRVLAVGGHARLPAGEGYRRAPQLVKGHAQQGNGNLFAGGQQHIHLPRRRRRADLRRFLQQFIGGIPLGRYDDHHILSIAPGFFRNGGGVEQPLCIGHRCAAKFQYDQSQCIVPPVPEADAGRPQSRPAKLVHSSI